MKNYTKVYLTQKDGQAIVVKDADEVMLYQMEHGSFRHVKYVNERERPHRLDGPAVILLDGTELYFVDGKKLSFEEFEPYFIEFSIEKMSGES